MPVKLTQEQRGPSVLLFCSFIGKDLEEQESEEYVIDNLAAVKTKVMSNDESFNCYFKYIKLDLENNVTIKINVSCEKPPYKKQWVCSANWSEWEAIGVIDEFVYEEYNDDDVYIYDLKLNIGVRKIETPMLHAKMYLDADFVDFSLSAVNGIVKVHKIVMASRSDVFKAMLNGEWKETAEGQIALMGTTRETLEHLKDYLYLDTLPDEGLCPLLLIAVRYLIEDLKQRCIAKLTDTLTSENMYELLDFACENSIPGLISEILLLAPNEIVHGAYQINKNKCLPKLKPADEK